MTSILDQENLVIKNRGDKPTISCFPAPMGPPSSGYVSVRMQEEPPIFSKQKMKLNLPHNITDLIVSNNWLMCFMSHQVLLRMFLLQPDRKDEVFFDKFLNGLKVGKMFLDPTGSHLFINLLPKSTNLQPELLYLHRRASKPKRIDRFRDHEITSIAFNYEMSCDASTGLILFGTSKGLIFETEFAIEGEKIFQNNWKQLPTYIPTLYGAREIDGLVFDIGKGENCPITGLQFFKVPGTTRYIIFAATPTKLYKFHEILRSDEKLQFQNVFNAYLNIPEQIKDFEISNSSLKYSKLRFIMNVSNKFPTHFAWLTEPGIVFAEIDQNAETPEFIVDKDSIPFPVEQNLNSKPEGNSASESDKTKVPQTFILTDFHALLIYLDHVTAISLLNHAVIYEEYFNDRFGRILDVVKDSLTGTIYLYSSNAIFRYKVTNEKRDVWQMYLEKKQFGLALKYSQDNPAHKDFVLSQQAEASFEAGNHIESALIYSETQTNFERVSLKFLRINNKKPLMIFLRNRLEKLRADDKTQITMLVVWMVELYLTEISRFNDEYDKVHQLQKEFDSFMKLPRVQECVRSNRSVIYDLMASHGDTRNLTALTTENKDYESVINQYINQNKSSDALSILRSQNKASLYYKYAPILMEEIPNETIAAIISHGKGFEPTKLIPTLICLENEKNVESIIKYLEFAALSLGSTEISLHNFLIKLYAKYNSEKLMIYLETQGKDVTLIHYDLNYALRVCQEHQTTSACVFLQCLLELWFPAVELALTYDSKMAQETASQPTDNRLKRKLWLRIAEHEIKGKNDVKKALELLKDCDLLRIEDLLPFFSDFQKIDDLKEVICDALKEYNTKIQEQQRDMEESAKSADRVRDELQTFRNRSVTVDAQDPCAICEFYLLLKPFFIFPCGHKFHGDCLEKQMIPLLTSEQGKKLASLKQQLETMLTSQHNSNQQQSSEVNLQQINMTREQIKYEMENILAADCLFCGIMIETINLPFIEDWDQVNVDWQ